MNDRNPRTPLRGLLYWYLALLIISLTLVVIALPRMRQAFEQSGMIELVREHLHSQESGARKGIQTSIIFPIPLTEAGTFRYASYEEPSSGSQVRHERVELLLEGPGAPALRDGAVTFIPKGTRLIGLTVSNQIAFVDLTKNFLADNSWDPDRKLRVLQLKLTVTQEPGIRDVVILVEGKPLE